MKTNRNLYYGLQNVAYIKKLDFLQWQFQSWIFFFVFFEALKQNKISENVSEIHFSFIIQ